MPQFQRAGVYVTEKLSGPSAPPVISSPSVAAFAGEHWRGPANTPIQCNNWNDFIVYFGGFNQTTVPTLNNPYLAYAVYEFFANGGQTAWVARITTSTNGSTGSSAALALGDQATTPQTSLTLQAGILGTDSNLGTWGNKLYAQVTATSVQTNNGRFDLTIYYGGNATSNIVERWTDLSINPTDARYVQSIINSTVQGSQYVLATVNSANTTTFPNNAPKATTAPAVVAFTGGVDPATPTNSDFQTAFTYTTGVFDSVSGALTVNAPGQTNTVVLNTMISYAQNRPYTFLVIDPPAAQTPAGVISSYTSLSASSNAAVYYPWIVANNPASSNVQATITLPPGGFVVGQMVNTDTTVGVWKAPAGLSTAIVNAVSAERYLGGNDLDYLNTNNINALKTRPNGQVVIWGTRTLQPGYATLYVPVRRTLNYIESTLTQLLDFAVFAPNDELLWAQITATCNSFLGALWGKNAFPGANTSQAFYVTCNSTNNTPTSVAAGVVNTTVGVALLYPAEFISLTISQFQTSGNTSVTSSVQQ